MGGNGHGKERRPKNRNKYNIRAMHGPRMAVPSTEEFDQANSGQLKLRKKKIQSSFIFYFLFLFFVFGIYATGLGCRAREELATGPGLRECCPTSPCRPSLSGTPLTSTVITKAGIRSVLK